MSAGMESSSQPRVRYGSYNDGKEDRAEIAVQVKNADFNGQSFDGSPFSTRPDWLLKAIDTAHIQISKHHGDRDYAVFEVVCGMALRYAFPGDWIIRRESGVLSVIEDQDAFILINLRPPVSGDEERSR